EIDVLTLGSKEQEALIAERNKRTIGLLRELFPDITKEVDYQINRIVNNVLQQVGPAVLGTALNNNSGFPRQRLRAENLDDSQYHVNTNMTLPAELIVFEPDKEFEESQRQSSQPQQNN
uniref:Uncharacterized protein n=1 Tax=Glossina austeni TaxID=7395 RepID=A0A1A9UEE8_GLOAU